MIKYVSVVNVSNFTLHGPGFQGFSKGRGQGMNVKVASVNIQSNRSGSQCNGVAIGRLGHITFEIPAFIDDYTWVYFKFGTEYQASNLKIGNNNLKQKPECIKKEFNNDKRSLFISLIIEQEIGGNVGNPGTAKDADRNVEDVVMAGKEKPEDESVKKSG